MTSDPASAPPQHAGFHHISLNVQDVERSAAWYREVLGFERLTGYETPDFARVILRHPGSGAILGVSRHRAAVASEPFDERRAGLDHLALRVADADALGDWVTHLDALGVEHSEVKPGAIPGSFLVTLRDPDGTQLEVFAAATPT